MRRSTAGYSQGISRLKQELESADAVVVGAGAGLSAAAGLAYSGERFEANFADFIEKYHFHDMYAAGFYRYASPEEYWAYWSRHIFCNRYAEPAGPLYFQLREILEGKEFFILTTNVDHCFQKAGFDKRRLFYTQGDYGLWQCSKPCHFATYDNETAVREMVARQREMRVPSALLPRCPVCGGLMAMNLRCDDTFVEDEGWRLAAARYTAFIREHGVGHVLYLELGVGENTPAIIKYPFWRMTLQNPEAVYACINLGDATAPQELSGRSICLDCDLKTAMKDLVSTP